MSSIERINISQPNINKSLALEYINEALESGQLAQGAGVAKGEAALASALNAHHAALYANGTASLRGALVSSVAHLINDERHVDRFIADKEVIIPAFSFNATLNTVLDSGAKARIVDIEDDTYTINPDQASASIGSKTVAIMPVDLYGQPANVSSKDVRFEGVSVVRDAAQAHGATMDGEPLTEHSDAVSLSFYPTKNIAAPEGGAILTNEQNIDRIARIYRNQGMSEPYVYDMVGDNLRMTDIHAAVLRANLGSLALVTARRSENATLLSKGLEDIEGITAPHTHLGMGHVWHQYTIQVDEDYFGIDRNKLKSALDKEGIGSGVYYPKIMTDHPVFIDHPKVISEETPIARKVASRVLSLPIHPGVGESDIHRIVETIKLIQQRGY